MMGTVSTTEHASDTDIAMSILSTIHQLHELLAMQTEQEELCDIWDRVCYRLDIYAGLVYQAINLGIFIWWMML